MLSSLAHLMVVHQVPGAQSPAVVDLSSPLTDRTVRCTERKLACNLNSVSRRRPHDHLDLRSKLQTFLQEKKIWE